MALYGDSSDVGVAQRLRALWAALYPDHNQGAFADELGLSDSALSNYLKGERRINLDAAITVAFKTQVTLDWLYLGNPAGLPWDLAQTITREPETPVQIRQKRPAKASRAR